MTIKSRLGSILPTGPVRIPGSGSPTVPPPSGRGQPTPPPSTPGAATVWPLGAHTVNRQYLRLSSMQTDPYLFPNPKYACAGDELPLTVTYEGATSVSSPSVIAYKNRAVVTDTLFPTNSPTASGNEVTLSTMKNLASGSRYVVEIKATVDGAILVRKLVVIVAVTGEE